MHTLLHNVCCFISEHTVSQLMSLPAAEMARCVGQLASSHGWAAAELLWQPPEPVWLLPALLLQLSRHGVFSRRGDGGGGGRGGGTIQLAAPEQAAATARSNGTILKYPAPSVVSRQTYLLRTGAQRPGVLLH